MAAVERVQSPVKECNTRDGEEDSYCYHGLLYVPMLD